MLSTALLLLRSSLFLSLHLSGNASSFPKPLSAEEEQVYLERCVQGDLEARNVLVERNMRLVAHIIKNGYPEGKILPGIRGRESTYRSNSLLRITATSYCRWLGPSKGSWS